MRSRGRMPDGVKSPSYIARGMEIKKQAIVAKTWVEDLPDMAYRKTLMDAARKGDPAAVKKLATEFRCRIYREGAS